MSRGTILVAGIGNVFLGDDGFGVVVAERLQSRSRPEGVVVVDFGIRGVDLAFALEDCAAAILIDAVRRGGPPGTLYLLDLEPTGADHEIDLHAMTPDRVLGWPGATRRSIPLRLVGCEPATFGPEGFGQAGLSPAVAAAVDPAVHMIEAMWHEFVAERDSDA